MIFIKLIFLVSSRKGTLDLFFLLQSTNAKLNYFRVVRYGGETLPEFYILAFVFRVVR